MTQNQQAEQNTRTAEKNLRDFALDLVKQKKFENLDQETFDMLVDDVYDRLEERVNAVMMANIPASKMEEFEALLSSGDRDALSDFTLNNIPDLQKILAESLVEFQKTYLGIK